MARGGCANLGGVCRARPKAEFNMTDGSKFGKFAHANGIIGLDNGGAGSYWISHSAPQIPHIIDGAYPGYEVQ